MARGKSYESCGIVVPIESQKSMAKPVTVQLLFRYLFLYSLLGYSGFLAVQGELEASGAALGGSVALFSLQKADQDPDPNQDEAIDELQVKILEAQHEVEYYKYKLIESDLRHQYQGLVNDNVLKLNALKIENDGFAATVTREQGVNHSNAQKISALESENTRLKDLITKMEKERIFTLKRSILKSTEKGFSENSNGVISGAMETGVS